MQKIHILTLFTSAALAAFASCTTIEQSSPGETHGTFCDSDAGSTGGTVATGGTDTGGAVATGGDTATGGTSTGGASTGGASTGGASTGGAGTGGSCATNPATFVQIAVKDVWGSYQAVQATFPVAEAAGDLNVVGIGWLGTTHTVSSVTDTKGNTYTRAIGPVRSSLFTLYVYYAKDVAAGTNTVTVTLDGAVDYPDLRISEYAGFGPNAAVEDAKSGTGSAVVATTPAVMASGAGELIYMTGSTEHRYVGAVSPFVTRLITPNDWDLVGDYVTTASGTYSARGQQNVASDYAQAAVSFAGNSQNCDEGSPVTYSTNFDTTELPISEGGAWSNVGLDWTNVQTSGGNAYGTQTVGVTRTGANIYNDSYARLSGFPPNQTGTAVVHRASNLNTSCTHEVEVLLRWEDSAHSAKGYECNVAFDGTYAEIVRWNGALGSYTSIAQGNVPGGVHDGDVLSCSMSGTTIVLSMNGTPRVGVNDSTYATGNPGMGFFRGANGCGAIGDFGFTQFEATGL